MDPLLLLLAALVALASGFVGGYGGRRLARWSESTRIGELEEALSGIDRRLRKREGQAGAEKRELERQAVDAAQLEIARIVAGWPQLRQPPAAQTAPEPAPRDRQEIVRRARAQSGRLNGAEPQGA